jgi:hypothetical protein
MEQRRPQAAGVGFDPGVPRRKQCFFGQVRPPTSIIATTKGGTVVSSSVIQSVSKGCALLENWTGAKGGQGKSLNAYNPLIHQWQQFWIGADGGVNEYRSSKVEGQSLVFLMEDFSNPSSIVQRRPATRTISVTVVSASPNTR